MKIQNIFLSLILIASTSFFMGCDDEDKNPVLTKMEPAVIDALSISGDIVLQEPAEDANPVLFTLTWNEAKFYLDGSSIPAAVGDVEYAIEMGVVGTDFSPLAELARTPNTSADLFLIDVNKAIVKSLGGEAGTPSLLEFRVVSYYGKEGNQANKLVSSVSNSLSIAPYDLPEFEGGRIIKWTITEGDWSEMAIYSWGDAEIFGGWPGKVLTPNEFGWYSVALPDGVAANLIINNNGAGAQLDLITAIESVNLEVNLSTGEITPVASAPITLRWKQPDNEWAGQMAIYSWGGTDVAEVFGGWPGKVIEANAEGWYVVALPAGQAFNNCILNNNGGGAQFDLNPILNDTDLEITGSSFKDITIPVLD